MTEGGAAPAPDPIDWATARRVARAVARRDPLAASYLAASLEPDFDAATARADDLVAEFTGLRPPGAARAGVLDRAGWVDANLESTRCLLAPVTARFGARLARSPLAPVGRLAAGSEMGVLLGYLAQRVLGQYDLFHGAGGDGERDHERGGGAVYYVGPNVLGLEKRFAFRPRDFRLWLAIHEVTHRAQFAGVPWMRDYFLGLVHEALSIVDPDPRVLARALQRAAAELRAGRNPLDDAGVAGLFASDEQRAALARVQALMSLLEGHGNYVMREVGRAHVAGDDRMARVLEQRRAAGGLLGLLHKVIGLEAKLRQYEVGEGFVRAAVRAAGPRAVDAAWTSPDALPTLAELRDPQAWLARVDGAAPAPVVGPAPAAGAAGAPGR